MITDVKKIRPKDNIVDHKIFEEFNNDLYVQCIDKWNNNNNNNNILENAQILTTNIEIG